MEDSSEKGTYPKLERMHEMALAMYRTGEYHAALKIWRRLQDQKSDFPDIDKWLDRVTQAIQAEIRGKPSPDPSVFRTQREIMVNNGQGPRRHIFHPRKSHVQLNKGIRHRHIVSIFLIILLAILLLSIRNNRSYMLILNPISKKLDCYQGNFFPLGWQKTLELSIGIENDWILDVKNQEIIRELYKGIVVHSVDRFNEQIVEIFMTLGDESLRQMNERSQQSAIYYYKRISSAQFEERVMDKIVRAFINLAFIEIAAKDYESAQNYLDSAREYNQNDPDIILTQRELDTAVKADNSYF